LEAGRWRLPLVRIETPFDDLFTEKAAPSREGSEQIHPVQAKKKKSNRTLKIARAADRRASSRPHEEVVPSPGSREHPCRLFLEDLNFGAE
jgi:hypothetical protein